jgi:hypothetical protein
LAALIARYGQVPGVRVTNGETRRKPRCQPGMAAATLQLTADDHLTSGIRSVDLKDRLGDVETDCRYRLHG